MKKSFFYPTHYRMFLCFCCLIALFSCNSEDQNFIGQPKASTHSSAANNQQIMPRFADDYFDPYTSNCLAENANMDFVDEVVGGLSFVSDYFDGDTSNWIDGYSQEQMALYLVNLYLSSQSISPISTLPNYLPLLSTDLSSTILGKLHEIRDYALDTSRLSVAYADFQYKCCHINLSSLTRSQVDTLSTIVYAMDITLNWALNDPMWDVFPKFNGPEDHISARWPNYPPGYHMSGEDWGCIFGIFGGAYVGVAGGFIGTIVGAVFGAKTMGGCNW